MTGNIIRTKLGEADIDDLYAAASIPGEEFAVEGKTPKSPVSPTKVPVSSPANERVEQALNSRSGSPHHNQAVHAISATPW